MANNSDAEPSCATNDTDACGVCAGPGPTSWYLDGDGDGQGSSGPALVQCSQPMGYVANNTDPCPLDNPNDTDGDGICDSTDLDDDGDGCPDGFDLTPKVADPTYNYDDDIDPIFDSYSCSGCHSGGGSWVDNLVMSGTAASDYAAMYDVTSADPGCGEKLIEPNDPNSSLLYRKLANTSPSKCDTGVMPMGCSDDSCLSSAELTVVYNWICQGASEH